MALLRICSCFCCAFIIIINLSLSTAGCLLILLGSLFTWGFIALSSTVSGILGGYISNIGKVFGNLNIDIDPTQLIASLSQITGSMGAAFLVIGVCVTVLACFGCCGACCSKKTCLLIYAIGVGLFVLSQGIVVIIWFVNSNVIKQGAKQAMLDSVKKFTGINSKNIHSLVQNVVHLFVGCCGVNNGSDFHEMSPDWPSTYTYNNSGYYFTYNLTYPLTCCKYNMTGFKPVDEFCSYNNTNTNTSWYQTGCYEKIFKLIDDQFQLNYIFYALGGVIGLQLLLVAGAVVMMAHITASSSKVKPV